MLIRFAHYRPKVFTINAESGQSIERDKIIFPLQSAYEGSVFKILNSYREGREREKRMDITNCDK